MGMIETRYEESRIHKPMRRVTLSNMIRKPRAYRYLDALDRVDSFDSQSVRTDTEEANIMGMIETRYEESRIHKPMRRVTLSNMIRKPRAYRYLDALDRVEKQ